MLPTLIVLHIIFSPNPLVFPYVQEEYKDLIVPLKFQAAIG